MDDDGKVIPIRPIEILLEVGGPVDEARVTLGLYGDELDPEVVSRRLGTAPSHAHKKGDARRSGPPWPKGAWLLTMEGKAPTDPDELMRALLTRFSPAATFWDELRASYQVRLSIGIHTNCWNRGFNLSPETLRMVTITGLAIEFDLYLYRDEGEVPL